MKRFLFLLLGLLLAAGAHADQIGGNRFLFIVQTSKDTRAQMTAVRSCLSNLFETRFSKAMHNGDSFGIWTFDDTLRAGNFPMQIWDGDDSEKITKKADDFLRKQTSTRDASLAAVLTPMYDVIRDSEAITVLIFTDGNQPIIGTPFDNIINRAFLDHRDQLRKQGVPFVTVLQAREGKILRSLVNSAAAPPVIGPVPTPPRALVATNAPAPEKKAGPVKVLPPLVVDYSKVPKPAAPAPATTAPTPGTVMPATSAPPPAEPAAVQAPVEAVPYNAPAVAPVTPAPVPTTPAPAVAQPAVPTPAPVVTAPVASVPVTAAPAKPESKPEMPRPAVSYPAARMEPAPTNPAPATAPQGGGSLWPLMFGAGLIAGLVVAVALWFFTRRDSAPRRSVITESLERDKK